MSLAAPTLAVVRRHKRGRFQSLPSKAPRPSGDRLVTVAMSRVFLLSLNVDDERADARRRFVATHLEGRIEGPQPAELVAHALALLGGEIREGEIASRVGEPTDARVEVLDVLEVDQRLLQSPHGIPESRGDVRVLRLHQHLGDAAGGRARLGLAERARQAAMLAREIVGADGEMRLSQAVVGDDELIQTQAATMDLLEVPQRSVEQRDGDAIVARGELAAG